MATCALPHLIQPPPPPSICMSTNPLQFQFNAAHRSAICPVCTMKLKYFPTAYQWFFCHSWKDWNHICLAARKYFPHTARSHGRCCIVSVMRTRTFELFTSVVTDWCDFRESSQRPITPWGMFALMGCCSDSCGEKTTDLMCPGPTRRTHDAWEKDACSHLCNHSGRSRGHTSPVPHFRANLSFHSPSLHIKQHKWLNLHDRICNMANQVSDSIKHYTGALS